MRQSFVRAWDVCWRLWWDERRVVFELFVDWLGAMD
jgi:hypothetical protein